MSAALRSMLFSRAPPARLTSTRSHRFSRSFVPGLDTLVSAGDPYAPFVRGGAMVFSSSSAATFSALLLRLFAMVRRNSDASLFLSVVQSICAGPHGQIAFSRRLRRARRAGPLLSNLELCRWSCRSMARLWECQRAKAPLREIHRGMLAYAIL